MKQLIGVDLGGTRLRAVRIDRAGHIFQHQSVATAAKAGPEAVISQMVRLIEQVMGEVNRADILGIGVGSPGPLDPDEGVVMYAPNLHGWNNVPLRALLQERTGLPVAVNNDGNVAALGEWHFGNGRGCQDFIYVGVGTGIGAGVIANGQLLTGHKGMAAEIGHMQIQPDGPVCSCGHTGCWEALAAGPALTRFAAQALQAGRPSTLQEQAAKGPVGPAEIFAAAARGDALAQDVLRQEGEYLGRGLVNLLHIFSPERITLGGGVVREMSWFAPHIRRVISEQAMPTYQDIPVEYTLLGDQVGVLGAATLLFTVKND